MSLFDRYAISDDLNCARKALACGVIGSFVITALAPIAICFEVDLLSFWPLALLALVPSAFIPYVTWRKMWLFRSILELSTVSLLLVVPGLVITYASMRFNMPMADTVLIGMDKTIGFNWPAFVRFVDQSALAAKTLEVAYESFTSQMIILPILLCIFSHEVRAYQYMLSFIMLTLLAAVVSIPFPSVGAYVGYGFDGATLRNINAHFGYFFLKSFNAVREQERFVLGLHNAAGIITFPSVHAGFAVLCAWAAWPSRWLRLPALTLNTLMVISAITHGAHYLVDVIAGCGAGGLAIWIATRQFLGTNARHSIARMRPAVLAS
jgi:membrane-associated phospholipid phosphatase